MSEDTTKKVTSTSADKDVDDAVQVEAEVKDVAPEPEPKPKPEPAPEPAPKPAAVESKPNVVVTPNAAADVVYLSKCVFENKFARKSLTVHHLQRRLYELGFKDAYSDKDGWYGSLTAKSVREYQEINGFEPTGIVDAATFEDIFQGDAAVIVNVVD